MAIRSKQLKLTPRQRRKLSVRKKVSGTDDKPRLSVFKSARHTYVQAISDQSNRTIAAASTREAGVLEKLDQVSADDLHAAHKSSKSVLAAKAVGIVLAERLKEKGIEKAVFDRNGYIYHGRTKAVADGAREAGIKI
ncbi:MAG: 50S ribosomal protein L18 [Candidatus Dadabacteria bacterium]|nr:MAG: 50S ribosomal protein L18 [Candidatus Dadabacteria bacterium]